MFFEQELERHLETLDEKFSNREILAILNQAIVDLKNRNIAGAFIVPLSLLVGGFATDYSSDHPSLFFLLGGILAIATLFRVFAIIYFTKVSVGFNPAWISVFFLSNIFTGIVWGSFSATSVFFYHNTLSVSLIIILLAGIGGGAMVSYCIWKFLSYFYLCALLVPTIIVEFYIQNKVTIPIGIAISFFLIFNLIQAKIWNKHFWLSLINTFVIEKNTLELKKLNIQLTEEIKVRKQTAKKIAISRKKLQDIYNSAHDGIFIFNLDGKVVDSNETLLKMFHISRQDALRFDIKKSFESRTNGKLNLQEIWRKVLSGEDQEFQWLTEKGDNPKLSTVQVNLRKTLWGEDSVVIATIRDITPQVEALAATSAANRAKSEFLANMSHELRTPMNGILGYARLGIKRHDTLPRDKIKEYFTIIHESGSRLMGLLNNILDFSKLEVGKMRYNPQTCDLLPRIHQIVREIKASATEKGLEINIECSRGQVAAFCDKDKISQVVRNLLSNAIKFSHTNSVISVQCIEITSQASTLNQQITISNHGAPIPNDELDTIFDKFIQSSTTSTGAGGTGLGLAISRQIVEDHGGVIWAKNGDNDLVLFSFLLPISPSIG
ncbi:PAS domain S-box [Desulfocapsa sulfexigens DSM 10523]|uniref:histidine kinase n=1 Tax=Desulfocapsa sulfexigens (strain DSM 10523 / SB164P1) TaxID=1167006 RepID=M1PD18_DESSD|nr:PAS domain-containing sensor histidine kinase [Desulfocapsa sulfexigens]AGF79492.1 PAS domain S-box [Desulfocapsa sulfexigens DSM 10523]